MKQLPWWVLDVFHIAVSDINCCVASVVLWFHNGEWTWFFQPTFCVLFSVEQCKVGYYRTWLLYA